MQKAVSDKDIQETPAPWEAAVFLIIDGVLLRYVGRDTFGTVQHQVYIKNVTFHSFTFVVA